MTISVPTILFLALTAAAATRWPLIPPQQHSANVLSPGEAEEGWRLLFDGKTLKGWDAATPGSWQVKDGTIAHGREAGMGAEGMIWTTEQFGDFIVSCEFKITTRCNSGIFFRVGDRADPVQTGFEMQINDTFARPVHPSGPKHNCGALYGIVAPSHNAAKPAGQWNEAVITCKGSIISISLNEDQVVSTVDLNQYTESEKNIDGTPNKFKKPLKEFPRSGYIGFQQHGGSVWFRAIKIKRL